MKRRKNRKKTILGIILAAFLVSLIPYRFRKDEETGAVEIRSLLWAWRKTPRREGETRDHYAFAMPPSGLDYVDKTYAGEADGETAEEE